MIDPRQPAELASASPRNGAINAMIRSGLVVGVAVAVLAAGTSILVWGMASLWSALTASAVTMGFFLIGMTGMKFVLGGAAGMSLAGAFVVYLGQLILLAVTLVALSRTGSIHPMSFVLNAIAQALAWQIGIIAGFTRARIPVVDGGRS